MKSLGWIILLVALAVPAAMFYQWWSEMQGSKTFEVKQSVPEGGAFGEARSAEGARLQNPIEAPKTAPETVPEEASGPGEAGAQAEPGVPADAPSPEPAPAMEKKADPNLIEYNPKSTRDPTLSLADLRELAKIRLQKQIARQSVKKALEPQPVKVEAPKPKESICDKLELQGIIAGATGTAAILNDEVVREGDSVLGAVVKRITTRTVVLTRGRKTVCVKRVVK